MNRRTLSATLSVLSVVSGVALAADLCFHLEPVASGCSLSSWELTSWQCIFLTTTDLQVKNVVGSETEPGKVNGTTTMTVVCLRTIGFIDSNGLCSTTGWSGTDSTSTLQGSISGNNCNVQPGGGGGVS